MQWLNYHHLLYFWTVAREGSISAASESLRLAPSTISGQIHLLEDSVGEPLFRRAGRGLVLTEIGQVVFRYAEEIFTVGRELQEYVQRRPSGRPIRLEVGAVDVVPKLMVHQLIQPVLKLDDPVHIAFHEDRPENLAAELALHQLDVVFTDAPLGTNARVKVFNHKLGECGISLFGTAELAEQWGGDFPRSLDGAPLLLPKSTSVVRRQLDGFFEREKLVPEIVGEFEDSALLKVFGQSGMGLFPAPDVIAEQIIKQYGVVSVGRFDGVVEQFYAVSAERKIQHPAVVAITEAARTQLFGTSEE